MLSVDLSWEKLKIDPAGLKNSRYLPEKTQIFDSLVSLTGVCTESNRLDDPEWDTFKNLITDCRDMHRRNEILITRKLDAIRGTLQTLNGGDTTASVEVYDRLGRMARSRGGRGYEEA